MQCDCGGPVHLEPGKETVLFLGQRCVRVYSTYNAAFVIGQMLHSFPHLPWVVLCQVVLNPFPERYQEGLRLALAMLY